MSIAIFVLFIVMAIRIANSIRLEAAIFDEFAQGKSLAAMVILFPLGPVALILLPYRVGWLPSAIFAAMCYMPALVSSRKQVAAFECSGTDRTNTAKNAATQAFGTALVGIIYVVLYVVFTVGPSSVVE